MLSFKNVLVFFSVALAASATAIPAEKRQTSAPPAACAGLTGITACLTGDPTDIVGCITSCLGSGTGGSPLSGLPIPIPALPLPGGL
ncbi:hypothetical protein M422DRAFT_240454 [Sphaerobolus stellatus SS14]|nr:hypothetical protein M422DRAFT_240454 [Sphaerobolus stellatus SS14]